MGGLPSSLDEILVSWCSAKLHEEVKKLKETNPGLLVSEISLLLTSET
jgi:hypothetical protein